MVTDICFDFARKSPRLHDLQNFKTRRMPTRHRCLFAHKGMPALSNSCPLTVVQNSYARAMLAFTEDKETELRKNGQKNVKKHGRFRITVEPLGFIYLTANIIQVR